MTTQTYEAITASTIKTLSPLETHQPNLYDLAAVGIVVPEATILHPSEAGHTDEMYANATVAHEDGAPGPDMAFSITHDGVLTKMHRFANNFGILGVPDNDAVPGKNAMVGFAVEQVLRGIDRTQARLPEDERLIGGQRFTKALAAVVPRLSGAFSIIVKHGDELFVATDRHDLGAAFIGELPSGGFVASSQEKAVAEYAKPKIKVESGTIVRIGAHAIHQPYQWLFK